VTVAVSDRNARRSDDAERARHIASSESVAFATMLLGLLNDADAVLHRMAHEPEQRAPEAAAPPSPPTETAPAPPGLADHGAVHQDQHAGTTETPAAEVSPQVHADDAATIQPQAAGADLDAASSGEVSATHAFASSPALSGLGSFADHESTASASAGHGGILASPSLDLSASIHNLADSLTGIVDTTLAAVSSTIASLGATVGQLTSTLTGTVSHLADGLTGAVTGLLHDTPATGLLAPPTSNFSGPTSGPTDFSGAAQHDGSLLDTAGAIPTSLLHPIPLHLGFLGQPTIDGHEPHDGAFSALGGHHF
jgi:hypothetical protein